MQEYFITLFILLSFNYFFHLPKTLKFVCMVATFVIANTYQIWHFHQHREQNYFELLGFQDVSSASQEMVETNFKKREAALQPGQEDQKKLYEAYDCLKVRQCLEQYNKYGYFLKQAEQFGKEIEELRDIRMGSPILYYLSFCMFATTVFKATIE